MDARTIRAALLAAILTVSMGASYRTPNFVIQTPTPQLAEQFGKAAERYRHELANSWLDKAMPQWAEPCVITVHVSPNLGAGGATTFLFDRGEVYRWRMTIQGSAERILDSVLPHEITHMVFACHFRQPLPRWADEGGATSVEHSSEQARYHGMLVKFLQTGRGIAFNQMFAMKEYPPDMMPLYAQGFALSEFLIQRGGRQKFLQFLGDGMQNESWNQATGKHYGFSDTGTLQNAWLAWVRKGFPPIPQPDRQPAVADVPEMLAANGKLPRPEPNLIYRIAKPDRAVSELESPPTTPLPREDRAAVVHAGYVVPQETVASQPKVLPASGWHSVGGKRKNSSFVAARESVSGGLPSAAIEGGPEKSQPVRAQMTHPQPIEQSRQIILEWHRRPVTMDGYPIGVTRPVRK